MIGSHWQPHEAVPLFDAPNIAGTCCSNSDRRHAGRLA
jgi:hypothetical protein